MRFPKGIIKVAVPLIIIGAVFYGWHNVQAIEDWWKLRNYTPPTDVSSIATEDTLTPYARKVFYVNHPDLTSNGTAFRQDCQTYEQTIVLGCYHSNQAGIFIYNVQDSRLDGVVEVTAAHEMLHGAYDRLSQKDKNYINGLLTNFYNNDLQDQRIKDTINDYKTTEPNDLVNEMHSIFGTEVANLPLPLEQYYQRYFANRSAIVSFANNYEGEFTSRLAQIKDYEQQLNTLKQQISDEESSLSAQRSKIDSDRRRLDSLRSQGQISEYNAAVSSFNAEVDAYNAAVSQLKSDIAEYNNIVEAHNSLAAELRGLYNALDTSLTPQTAQ